MEEGVFGEWLKAPGELIRAGDMLFLLEGEKAATEIESLDAGYLCIPADAPQPGTTVRVGDVIGFLIAEREPPPSSVGFHPTLSTAADSPPEAASQPSSAESVVSSGSPLLPRIGTMPRAAGPAARRLARKLGIDLSTVVTPDPTGRILCEDVESAARARIQKEFPGDSSRFKNPSATPRARRRARELGVDWTRLVGTGRNGRIRECDVSAGPIASMNPDSINPESLSSGDLAPTEPGHHVPASKLRRIIARRMSAGVHFPVPVTLTTKIPAESLVAFRERLRTESTQGRVPGYNDILIDQAAQTLRELPYLNACWHRNGVYHYDAIHIATAVDAPDGLLAPVVRDADQKTLQEIADITGQMIAAARSGQLSQSRLSGGTFTISSLGMFGIDSFTPVLNMPQAAILGVGRIVEEPVVRNGQLMVGRTLTLSLTFDHRVVDGAPAARWLQRLSERLQFPEELSAG